MVTLSNTAFAYIGPGGGLSATGTIALIGAILFAIVDSSGIRSKGCCGGKNPRL